MHILYEFYIESKYNIYCVYGISILFTSYVFKHMSMLLYIFSNNVRLPLCEYKGFDMD